MGGAPETPEVPADAGAAVTPEGFNKNDLNILLEENLFGGGDYMDLAKGRNSLLEINDKLKDLLS